MKVAFNSRGCPDGDVGALVGRAKALGYDGIELAAPKESPLSPSWIDRPDEARRIFQSAGIEPMCLATAVTLASRRKREIEKNKALVRTSVEQAARLGCSRVRVFPSGVPRGGDRYATLSRIADVLRELAPFAAGHRVTLVVENSGDLCTSDAIWYMLDSAQHPAVMACWNPLAARAANERPTVYVPRLGPRIAIVRICDAKFDDRQSLRSVEMPGHGDAELHRMIQLLRGVGYDGYLVFDWPKDRIPSLAGPDESLPTALKFLRDAINEEQKPLSAYKGDKNAPRFAGRPADSLVSREAG